MPLDEPYRDHAATAAELEIREHHARVRRPAQVRRAQPMPPPISEADRQAQELIARAAEHVEVAKSVFRITAGMLQGRAAQASQIAKAIAAGAMSQGETQVAAKLGQLQKIARAAAAAALDVTTHATASGEDTDVDDAGAPQPIPVRRGRRPARRP